ncbi:MAG: hypothetical protein M1829_000973 [Trizodia sp. TS-e1964]|nr:MAG: hypothetical protein M1829_000973 [Trizodia sp. TS-e1964]
MRPIALRLSRNMATFPSPTAQDELFRFTSDLPGTGSKWGTISLARFASPTPRYRITFAKAMPDVATGVEGTSTSSDTQTLRKDISRNQAAKDPDAMKLLVPDSTV